jgi:hypothetical protein
MKEDGFVRITVFPALERIRHMPLNHNCTATCRIVFLFRPMPQDKIQIDIFWPALLALCQLPVLEHEKTP